MLKNAKIGDKVYSINNGYIDLEVIDINDRKITCKGKYLIENYQENLEKRYDIQINDIINQETPEDDDYYGYEQTDSTMQVLEAIARKRGAILSGGRINEQKIADIILGEFQTGKIGRITIEKVK